MQQVLSHAAGAETIEVRNHAAGAETIEVQNSKPNFINPQLVVVCSQEVLNHLAGSESCSRC